MGERVVGAPGCATDALRGRDREIAALETLFDGACSGSGGALVVEGDAGIGKTALVRAACRVAAERGMRVLHARGSELEDGLAFGVTRELYGPVGGDLTGAAALAEPVLRAVGSTTAGDLFAVLHGLYWVTADLASTAPLLVAVDDAQWCDEPTLRHLAYLAHRLDGLAVALVLATRPGTDAGRTRLVGAITAEPVTTVRRPGPLPPPDVHQVVAATFSSVNPVEPEFAAACHALTGGNPFLLTELIAEATAAGLHPVAADVDRLRALSPPGVQRAVEARLARLPAEATTLARAVAVLGDGTSMHRAARLAGLSDTAAGPLADALVTARVLQPRVTASFVHPLVRSAITDGMGPSVAGRWHRRAAELLAADGVPGDELVPHLLAAPPAGDQRVVASLREAAQRAEARGAPDAAARYLRRALDEPPAGPTRAVMLLELGVAQTRAADPEARSTLAAALRSADDPADRARVALVAARDHFQCGRVPEAVAVCEDALAGLGPDEPDLRLALEVELVTAATQDLRTRPAAVRIMRDRGPDPEPVGRVGCLMLANLAIEEVIGLGDPARAAELAEKALCGMLLTAGDAIVTLPSAVFSLTLAGRARRSVQIWDDVLVGLRARGEMWGFAVASAFRGYAALHLGDVRGAVADARCALDLAGTAGMAHVEGFAAAWLGYALLERADVGTVAEELGRGAPDPGTSAPFAANFLLSARGRLRLAQGRDAEAVTDLRECGRRVVEWGVHNPALCPWQGPLAVALFRCGRSGEAADVAWEALDAARRWGTPHVVGDALRVAGLVTGDVELSEEAVTVAAGGESPLEHARALADLGGALRRAGSARVARDPLRAAVDLAVACGATAVARRARDELVAAGARPRRLRSTGADALTSSQRRVAAMAAEGQTSREIAQALFVSQKTVETHLTQAFRKLGISARSQLAEALEPAG